MRLRKRGIFSWSYMMIGILVLVVVILSSLLVKNISRADQQVDGAAKQIETESCAEDCEIKVTNHFASGDLGSPEVAYSNTKGYGVIFIDLEVPEGQCEVKFRTSEGQVDITINTVTFSNITTKYLWNYQPFDCQLLNGNYDKVRIVSHSETMSTYYELGNSDAHVDQYTQDGENWLETSSNDMAIDIIKR
ncbi:hypothetical protein HYW21_05885 [Candidatus Woesearchaeota archaeon]|nr:hypothetical protein [Candidatus Woesearchaeota archaeon]